MPEHSHIGRVSVRSEEAAHEAGVKGDLAGEDVLQVVDIFLHGDDVGVEVLPAQLPLESGSLHQAGVDTDGVDHPVLAVGLLAPAGDLHDHLLHCLGGREVVENIRDVRGVKPGRQLLDNRTMGTVRELLLFSSSAASATSTTATSSTNGLNGQLRSHGSATSETSLHSPGLQQSREELDQLVDDLLLLVVFLSQTEDLTPQSLILALHVLQLVVDVLLPLLERPHLGQDLGHLLALDAGHELGVDGSPGFPVAANINFPLDFAQQMLLSSHEVGVGELHLLSLSLENKYFPNTALLITTRHIESCRIPSVLPTRRSSLCEIHTC